MTLLRELKSVAKRSHATLVQDAIGAAALCVLMIVALHMPQVL